MAENKHWIFIVWFNTVLNNLLKIQTIPDDITIIIIIIITTIIIIIIITTDFLLKKNPHLFFLIAVATICKASLKVK